MLGKSQNSFGTLTLRISATAAKSGVANLFPSVVASQLLIVQMMVHGNSTTSSLSLRMDLMNISGRRLNVTTFTGFHSMKHWSYYDFIFARIS